MTTSHLSIQQIADAPLKTVESALGDSKAARSLQNACKAHLKRVQTTPSAAAGKRPASASLQAEATKKARFSATIANNNKNPDDDLLLGPTDLTPHQLEASLALAVDTDEARIAETALYTNRAPLVVAFAVELLRHTMPEQPPSSRLSLAQAVVSANSRSKAVSLGLEKGASADEEGWGEGQPRIKIMSREVSVLKRGGYVWKEEEEEEQDEDTDNSGEKEDKASEDATLDIQPKATTSNSPIWSTSSSITLKQSTFVARATTITEPSQRPNLLKSLLNTNPSLQSASHNVWAYRIRPSASALHTAHVREASHDDGETGGGDLLLRVLRDANVVDTLVVMTRWYGGVMLGPDRWRLMRNVVTGALSERLRISGVEARLRGEAVWGLDLEAMRKKTTDPPGFHKTVAAAPNSLIGGLVIHRPEAARNYLLRSFPSAPSSSSPTSPTTTKKRGGGTSSSRAQDATEKEQNLALLLGALRLLFDSWADRLPADELDRRAWGWYSAVRPAVASGAAGWGAKGVLQLKDLLDLRRKPTA